jgi:hypothetical protein
MTPQSFKVDISDFDSQQTEPKRFMNRRLGGHLNPSTISSFKLGTNEFE